MTPSLEVRSRSVDETREVGEAIAPLLAPGDVVSLSGDLGAGKTAFVQGAARGLGVQGPVLSPTFVLVREYRGVLPVLHVDVYRLTRMQEVMDLGLDDYLELGRVVFIEWGDVVDALFPDAYLEVGLTMGGDDDARRITLTGRGTAWLHRWERVEQVLGRWAA